MLKRILFYLSFCLIFALFNISSQSQQQNKTLNNLLTSYNSESNAAVKYLVFARVAEQEGYKKVASLFRAAAKAEEVHKNHLAMVIKKMSSKPKVVIETPAVKSTKENLESALQEEAFGKDKMYPKFIKQAKAEKNKDAVRVFNNAKSSEADHVKFYSTALKNLPEWKLYKTEFFVCSTCGFTVERITFEKCPICSAEKAKFLKVD